MISREFYKEFINTNINSIREIEKPDLDKVEMANGNVVKVDKAIKNTFKLDTQTFTEDFLVLIVTTPVILGNPFFVKHQEKVSIKKKSEKVSIKTKLHSIHRPNSTNKQNKARKATQKGSKA